MKIGCMGRWKGSGVVSAPHRSPGWGQAPALHFSVDPRQVPAHQGMKIGCMGRWKGSGVASAPHRSPGWGQAPALHFSVDPRQVPAHQGMKIGCMGRWKGSGVASAPHRSPGWGQAPRYISPLTLRCRHTTVPLAGDENWVHWSMEGFRCRLCPPPLPWLGTSPSPTFLR